MVKRNNGMKYLASLILCLFLCGCGTHAGENEILIGRKAQDGMDGAGGTESAELLAETEDSSGQDGREGGQDAEKAILVHVCGAVKNPGVVSLPEGSRAQDALDAAGGFSENAGRDFVNLAEPVQDGQKLYFPTTEEANASAAQGAALQETGDGRVNINTADIAALCTLPGIGEARARDIIAYRDANGAFENCEDIMKVSGIKDSVYGRISDKIKVR